MLFKCDAWSIFPFHLGALAPQTTPPIQYGLDMFPAFFYFFTLPPDPPSLEREGCVNNARQTLNVRAKNSQFPSIVSLAFAACFMHFIISAGVSEERSRGEGGLAVMGIAYFCERWRFKKLRNFIWKANLSAPRKPTAGILLWINTTYHWHTYNVCMCVLSIFKEGKKIPKASRLPNSCFTYLQSGFKVLALNSWGFQSEKEEWEWKASFSISTVCWNVQGQHLFIYLLTFCRLSFPFLCFIPSIVHSLKSLHLLFQLVSWVQHI